MKQAPTPNGEAPKNRRSELPELEKYTVKTELP